MDTRQQILDAALKIYSQHGFRGATTRRIADAAGVNEVTVFRHFGSKDALLAEALRFVGEEGDAYRLPAEPIDPLRELSAWSEFHLADLRARRAMIRTCMGELEERPGLTECASSPPRRAFNELCDYFVRLRETGATSPTFDVHAAAAMLMGAVFADAMVRDMAPDIFPSPPDSAPRRYVELLLHAIGVAPAELSADSPAHLPVPDATGA